MSAGADGAVWRDATADDGGGLPHEVDLKGRRFGKLVVMHRTSGAVVPGRSTQWTVRCDCGTRKRMHARALLGAVTAPSCGCVERARRAAELAAEAPPARSPVAKSATPIAGWEPPVRVHLPIVTSARAHAPHSQSGTTLSMRRQSKREMQRIAEEYPDTGKQAPAVRSACPVERPCGYVSCAAHLALDINEDNGNIKVLFPDADKEPDLSAMQETCLYDAIDRGGMTLEEVGTVLGITRERVRQLEGIALAKIKAVAPGLAEYLTEERSLTGAMRSRHVGIRATPDAHVRGSR